MNFISSIKSFFTETKQLKQVEEVKSTTSQLNEIIRPYSTASIYGWSEVRASQAWRYYKQVAPIRDSVDFACDMFLTVPFAIKDLKTNELITEYTPKIKATQIFNLLDDPNDIASKRDFLESIYKNFKVCGEVYILTTSMSEDSLPTEIYCVNPKSVTINQNSKEEIMSIYIGDSRFSGTYERKQTDSGVIFVSKNGMIQVRQFKEFNPDSALGEGFGLSCLSSVYFEIEELASIHKNNIKSLKKGVRPAGAIVPNSPPDSYGSNLTEEQILQLKNNINAFYAGNDSDSNVMVLDGIKEFIELSTNNRDMEFASFQDKINAQIYRNLRIPAPLISSESMTYSNFKEALNMLIDINTLPFSLKFCDVINAFLMPRYDDVNSYQFTVDIDSIPAIQLRRFELVKELKADLTVNERREIIGYEPIPEGDTLDSQMNSMIMDLE
jgi:HK97 family phage portal protein